MYVRVRVDLVLLEPLANPARRRVIAPAGVEPLVQSNDRVTEPLPLLRRYRRDIPADAIT
jgi:hypothetical protein